MTPTVYGASTVKRDRWSQAELAELDDLIVNTLTEEQPATVRGVFYRVESMGAVPKTDGGYRRIARRVLQLRREHVIPYRWITDGTRYFLSANVWDDLDEGLAEFQASYRRNLWRDQGVRVEVFTEKDAISGLLSPITARWGIRLGVLRGYCSESFAFEAADDYARAGEPVFVYHFGDHDPSGVNAWEDFQRKVRGFAPDADITFVRAAVTLGQIDELALPTRPTKTSDTRARNFIGGSVEVDAIPPSILRTLAEELITDHIDEHQLHVTRSVEEGEREQFGEIVRIARGAA